MKSLQAVWCQGLAEVFSHYLPARASVGGRAHVRAPRAALDLSPRLGGPWVCDRLRRQEGVGRLCFTQASCLLFHSDMRTRTFPPGAYSALQNLNESVLQMEAQLLPAASLCPS